MNARNSVLVMVMCFGSSGCAVITNSSRSISTSVSMDSAGNMVVSCTITAIPVIGTVVGSTAVAATVPAQVPEKPAANLAAAPKPSGPGLALLSTQVNIAVGEEKKEVAPKAVPALRPPLHPRRQMPRVEARMLAR